MESTDLTPKEAEFAGFVDRGTQIVLQEAIKKVVEAFQQTDALEDILKYLEEMRTHLQTQAERIKDLEQTTKQNNDRSLSLETSTRGLLQRIQTMEIQLAENTKQIAASCQQINDNGRRLDQAVEAIQTFGSNLETIAIHLQRLLVFFERPPFQRLFGKFEPEQH